MNSQDKKVVEHYSEGLSIADQIKFACYDGENFLMRLQRLTSLGVDPSHNSGITSILSQLQSLSLQPPQNINSSHNTEMSILGIGQDAKISSLYDLRQALHGGDFTRYPVGTILPDIWTDAVSGKVYDAPWRVVDYRRVTLADGSNPLAAILMRVYATPVQIPFDAAEKDGAPFSRDKYGYNRFTMSFVKQWLNSADPADAYWRPQHDLDLPPRCAKTLDGYLRGCSRELLDVICPIMIESDYRELPGKKVITEREPLRMFLPRAEELHLDIGTHLDLEKTTYAYFRDTPTKLHTPCQKRVFLDIATHQAQLCWLRSAYRGYANDVWVADTDGSVNYFTAYNTCACAPACAVIG